MSDFERGRSRVSRRVLVSIGLLAAAAAVMLALGLVAAQMWTVTTTGDLPDDHEERVHNASAAAWLDYNGRILEYEIAGYLRDDWNTRRTGAAGHATSTAAPNESTSRSNAPAD
jgi:hypothetical protein